MRTHCLPNTVIQNDLIKVYNYTTIINTPPTPNYSAHKYEWILGSTWPTPKRPPGDDDDGSDVMLYSVYAVSFWVYISICHGIEWKF